MSKKIVFGMALMCILFGSLYAKEQNFVKEGKQPADFVGKKARLISTNYGDLNGDNRKDMVLVIEDTNPKNIKKGEGYDSSREFNYNPRTILVMFQDEKGVYHLEPSSINGELIPPEDDEENPNFIVDSAVDIKNNQLIVSFTTMMSMGSWYATSSVFRFRYQNNQFVLIGADTSEWHRASGVGSEDSYNYLTNVHEHTEDLVVMESEENEGLKPKITTSKINPKMKKLTPMSEVENFNDY
ncbi:MAG: hypothetical protein PHI79_07980 [Sulfurovaceae bacterium]|nr:hypothetical protein [Sulfurovaceae bacterium]